MYDSASIENIGGKLEFLEFPREKKTQILENWLETEKSYADELNSFKNVIKIYF